MVVTAHMILIPGPFKSGLLLGPRIVTGIEVQKYG